MLLVRRKRCISFPRLPVSRKWCVSHQAPRPPGHRPQAPGPRSRPQVPGPMPQPPAAATAPALTPALTLILYIFSDSICKPIDMVKFDTNLKQKNCKKKSFPRRYYIAPEVLNETSSDRNFSYCCHTTYRESISFHDQTIAKNSNE